MRFGFVTCVQIGLSCMEAIYEAGSTLDLIVTLPDDKAKKKSGRIYVDEFASKHNIRVVKSNHVNDQIVIDAIKKQNIDWLFIIGWSQIASVEVINAPNYGVIGAHPTLLPQGRGRAAIPWAIIKGLTKTGVSFFKMDEGVDTGLILGQKEVEIEAQETATTLYAKVNLAHEKLIRKLVVDLKKNDVEIRKQDETKATYWEGRKPSDGEINANMTMDYVDKLVRATTKPYPGAFIYNKANKVIVWEGFPSNIQLKDKNLFEIQLADGFFYGEKFEVLNLKKKN